MTEEFINPALGLPKLSDEMQRSRRVQINNFLKPEIAEATYNSFDRETEWSFAIRDGEEDKLYSGAQWEAIPIDQRRTILAAANRQASGGFQYMFDYYSLLSNYHAGTAMPAALSGMAEFVESPELLDFVRQLTGSEEIAKADGQATRYRAGQFLTYHDDHFLKERRFAYVLNLTKAWRADWGGLLLFHDNQGNVTEGWLPNFNCLNLFAVPQGHSVSFVTPFAAAYRYSITGWFSVE